jgi:formylglycine-generating enzyme required for sulfatase activity
MAGGVFLSVNNGINWTKTSLDTVSVTSFSVNGNNIFAGTDKGLFHSTNNGANWDYIGLKNVGLVSTVPNKTNGTTIIAGGGSGNFDEPQYTLVRSIDNGKSWVVIEDVGLMGAAYATSIVYIDSIIYLGKADWLYMESNELVNTENSSFILCSHDYGVTWIAVDSGFYGRVFSLTVMGNHLFAGTYGIWRRPLSEMIPTTDSLLVPVAGGTFTAGTTPVTISSFKIDKYEVTYELWTEVRNWALTHGYTDLAAGKNGYNPAGANNPVDSVNWYDVVKWCNARSEKDGLTPVYYTRSAQDTVYRIGQININIDAVKWTTNGYRLPTEAEWEFAARGGNFTHGYTYSGSNTLDSVAWYYTNSGNTTHTVGTKKGNELGIYDMSGNVRELCWDCYGEDFPSGGTTDPKGPSKTGGYMIFRGGSFRDGEFYRVDVRPFYSEYDPEYFLFSRSNGHLGFRCAQGSQVSTAVKDETKMTQTFVLAQNYPNPFNPSTTIRYVLPNSAKVRLMIYDLLGREIATLVNEEQSAGWKEVEWNGSAFSSGIYFYRIQAGTFSEVKKMMLIK